ncbi:MAG: bifunctional phosphoribosylaminoimidazolecarboxamide formyltransferase/IMP cyclohydrolase [Bacteroidales bacterium]|nr:bifunctional phosphoribosylaminoimidazolecarboxamide formyltransferase/IMP cyclohydrolase [Bacteroidales bacterium]
MKPIKNALISVFHKDGLLPILSTLKKYNINIITTGGTYKFIEEAGYKAQTVESLTDYPSIFGGRVKTLHPIVFGGILYRRDLENDQKQALEFKIPPIDLVIVDLYPFEKTLEETSDDEKIIEKIDIGGISLIRAAAKNYKDVLIVSSMDQYAELVYVLDENQGKSTPEDRKRFAMKAFNVSSHYDTAIFSYFNQEIKEEVFKSSIQQSLVLRYGENPHQKGVFYGHLEKVFEQLHGKAISYNNIIDLDGGIALIKEFSEPTFAILKHTNACGLASDEKLLHAWKKALAGDPVSAFGGVLIANRTIDQETAEEINKLFFEIILAPGFEKNALETLKTKKNRIILQAKSFDFQTLQFKTALNGVIAQDKDLETEELNDWEEVTVKKPSTREANDLVFANKIVKHTKSNAIVLTKDGQLIGSGTGQTSRIDALKHAIQKAKDFGLDLHGAVMASDAFFPFADSVEFAEKEGIKAVIQPGGSVRDKDSIDYCNKTNMSMVFTGIRHFKH